MSNPRLPVEIHKLIIEEAGAPWHPLGYARDSATLASLCLVSRSFNAVTTLYASVRLSGKEPDSSKEEDQHGGLDLRQVTQILRIAQVRPDLIALVDSLPLNFNVWAVHLAREELFLPAGYQKVLKLLSQMPSLRRPCSDPNLLSRWGVHPALEVHASLWRRMDRDPEFSETLRNIKHLAVLSLATSTGPCPCRASHISL